MYISKEELQKAKELDLLSYMKLAEPSNLKKVNHKLYHTVDHESLKISNGLWYWFKYRIGGKSALDYLIKVRGYSLPEAVNTINGITGVIIPEEPIKKEEKVFAMPAVSKNTDKAYWYLIKRGIHPEVIQYCIKEELVFETEQHHNVLFVGYDEEENPRYGNLRGAYGTFKGEVTGSDKRYAFKICVNPESEVLNVFESAIDLLSLITLKIMRSKDWKNEAYISLGGVSGSKEIPSSLKHYLAGKQIKEIRLYLDNDEAGQNASKAITDQLPDKYIIKTYVPKYKDVNEDLQMFLKSSHD